MKDYSNLDTKAATANQAMDTILALTEKLQQAEARALAAETTLELVRRQLERETPGWVVRVEYPNLDSAREVMRKAEEWGAIEQGVEWSELLHLSLPKRVTTLAAIADEMTRKWSEATRISHELCAKRDALRAERDELAALVDQVRVIIDDAPELNMVNYSEDQVAELNGAMIEVSRLLHTLTGATALADLKAQVRREVLEEAAKVADEKATEAGDKCGDLRKGDATRYAYAGVSDSLHGLAAELRRMAGEGK